MVALQILVLSVWVRVLVEQQRRDLMGLFLVLIPTQPQVLRRFALSILSNNYFGGIAGNDHIVRDVVRDD